MRLSLEQQHLAALIKQHGSQRAVAKLLHVSEPYISDLANGRRRFSDRILKALGLARTVQEAK